MVRHVLINTPPPNTSACRRAALPALASILRAVTTAFSAARRRAAPKTMIYSAAWAIDADLRRGDGRPNDRWPAMRAARIALATRDFAGARHCSRMLSGR